jgi:hypothetical protein
MLAGGIVGRKEREERANRKRLTVWKDLRVTTASTGKERGKSDARRRDFLRGNLESPLLAEGVDGMPGANPNEERVVGFPKRWVAPFKS